MTSLPVQLHPSEPLASASAVYPSPQPIAVIDLGSNSFRLIVIEYAPRLHFRVVDEVRETVRLSEGMAEANIMRAAAMDRAARVMRIYAAFCRASGITAILAAGTSAIRDAHNQASFLARLEAETGIPVRVLSGYEEAYYGYLAAVNSTPLHNGYVLDLGGGSLQISQVNDRHLGDTMSQPLGAVRMTERFLTSDPASSGQIQALRQYLRQQFEALPWFKRESGLELVGEGGALRLTGRLAQKLIDYPLDTLHGYRLSADQVETVCDEVARCSVSDRKRLPGMKPDRADISLGGALVIAEALRAGGFDSITICSQGVREGLFYERYLDGHEPPLFADVRQASVLNLAHLYRFQEHHARHIAHLTRSLFDQLPATCHQCGAAERELLWAASMLHDIGVAVDYHDHHKHSAYLILNAGLPGYSHRETALIALLARYHRKGSPSPDEFAALLDPDDDRRLLQLSALLRLAEQLDRSRDGVVHDVRLTTAGDWAQLELLVRGDGQVALWSVERHIEVFQQAFGLTLEVTMTPSAHPPDAPG